MSADKKYRPYFTAAELSYLYELVKDNPTEHQPTQLLSNLKSWVLKVQEGMVAPALTIKERDPMELIGAGSKKSNKSDPITAALKSGFLSEEEQDALFASQMAQLTPQK